MIFTRDGQYNEQSKYQLLTNLTIMIGNLTTAHNETYHSTGSFEVLTYPRFNSYFPGLVARMCSGQSVT